MQYTAPEIAAMLADRAEEVAVHLLGNGGKRMGKELRYGSIRGEPGESFSVCISGSNVGKWADFAGNERGGNLVGLWINARDLSAFDAIAEAKEFLGIRDVPMNVGRAAPAVKPLPKPKNIIAPTAAALDYLRTVRLITDATIAAYKLRQRGDDALLFPFLLPDGTLAQYKLRRFPEDKVLNTAEGGAKVLFGWQAIPRNARTVVIAEGEYKAMLWNDYGYPALSVPYGGGGGAKQDWIQNEYDRLALFDTIYLALDEDENGRAATDAIIQRLGPERCAIVSLPLQGISGGKDIQSCRRAGVAQDLIDAAIRRARPRDPDELRSANDYAEALANRFEDQGPEPGLRTPWRKVGDELVFRNGEVTLIIGINGHGKSQLVGFLVCHALTRGYRFCIASLEFRVVRWLERLVKQLCARRDPAPAFVRRIADEWLSSRLWAFDAQGTTDWRRMIEVFRYARRRYGVEFFVVDNMTGLGIGEDDYQQQKEFVQAITNFARDEDCHVWVVHHPRKTEDERQQPGKMDSKGAGAIMDIVPTGLSVWRNKAKEDKLAAALAAKEEPSADLLREPDVRVKVFKQRNYPGLGNGEPTISLWWAPGCFHYLGNPNHHARPFRMEGLNDHGASSDYDHGMEQAA